MDWLNVFMNIKKLLNFKEPKVTFETNVIGVDRLMPIIKAKDYKHQWVQKALREFTEVRKQPNYGMEKLLHTARCPGIFKLQRQGWILRTWQDITIETNGDGENFLWTTPINQRDLNGEDYVGSHPKSQMHDYMSHWPKDTLSTVLKINTSWRCVVPKGYYLMEMPVAHADEDRFTTLPGFFSREQGPATMNVQLLWHVMNGKTLIKAGTPIAQYILVPQEQVEMECTGPESNVHQVFSLANNNRFVKNYGDIKTFFNEFQ